MMGLSWGGAMAACAALVSQAPVACLVGLGSDSPRVMATGALRWQLDWAALASASSCTVEQARHEVISIFRRITFATVLERAPRPDSIASVVQVGARDDWYVDAAESRQLFDSLRHAVRPLGWCRFEWVPGGHATAFVRQTAIFVPACVEAVDAAEAHRAKQGFSNTRTLHAALPPGSSAPARHPSGSFIVARLAGAALALSLVSAVVLSRW